jgi:hypothetical protein
MIKPRAIIKAVAGKITAKVIGDVGFICDERSRSLIPDKSAV